MPRVRQASTPRSVSVGFCSIGRVKPTTRHPARFSIAAVSALSTPPDMPSTAVDSPACSR